MIKYNLLLNITLTNKIIISSDTTQVKKYSSDDSMTFNNQAYPNYNSTNRVTITDINVYFIELNCFRIDFFNLHV